MRLYTREDFMKLPDGTIYSNVNIDVVSVMEGLFCKTENVYDDFYYQDLLDKFIDDSNTVDCQEAYDIIKDKRDSFKNFETDYNSDMREGLFDSGMVYVVWDTNDKFKLIDYLLSTIDKDEIRDKKINELLNE